MKTTQVSIKALTDTFQSTPLYEGRRHLCHEGGG